MVEEINKTHFLNEFHRLEASMGVTKTVKLVDQWYEEFKHCQLEAFNKTMQALRFGEKFPTWRMYMEQYRIFEDREQAIVSNLCRCCLNGRVYWVWLKKDYGAAYYSSPCKMCQPKADGAIDPGERAWLYYSCPIYPDAWTTTNAKIDEFEAYLYKKKHVPPYP